MRWLFALCVCPCLYAFEASFFAFVCDQYKYDVILMLIERSFVAVFRCSYCYCHFFATDASVPSFRTCSFSILSAELSACAILYHLLYHNGWSNGIRGMPHYARIHTHNEWFVFVSALDTPNRSVERERDSNNSTLAEIQIEIGEYLSIATVKAATVYFLLCGKRREKGNNRKKWRNYFR